jgi:hypothetical protein
VTVPDYAAGADRWWDDARRRERLRLLRLAGRGRQSGPNEAGVIRPRIASPEWVAERLPPRLPSRWAIALYWAEMGADAWFDVCIEAPHCFACGVDGGGRSPFFSGDEPLNQQWDLALRLQRGHIVNRARGGLDAFQNLVLLCRFCNKNMPVFRPEDEDDAVAWINNGGAAGAIEARLAPGGRRREDDRHRRAQERAEAERKLAAADQLLARLVRSPDPGRQLRAAGYATLAEALGY